MCSFTFGKYLMVSALDAGSKIYFTDNFKSISFKPAFSVIDIPFTIQIHIQVVERFVHSKPAIT